MLFIGREGPSFRSETLARMHLLTRTRQIINNSGSWRCKSES